MMQHFVSRMSDTSLLQATGIYINDFNIAVLRSELSEPFAKRFRRTIVIGKVYDTVDLPSGFPRIG